MLETPAERDRFIDTWRGLAVLMVVLYHYANRLPSDAYGYVREPLLQMPVGMFGVEIFFVISGFLVGPAAARAPSLAGFLARRVSRIWPLLALAACTVYVFTQFLPPPLVREGPQHFNAGGRTLGDLFGTIFLLADLGFRWIDGAYWSLLVEMKFYVLLTLLVALCRAQFTLRLGQIAAALGGIYLLCRLPGFADWTVLRKFASLLIGPYLPFFAIGVYWGRSERPPLLVVNLMLAIGVLAFELTDEPFLEAAGVIGTCLITAAFVTLDSLVLRNRIILWIGRYSYAIYLFHQVIGLSLLVRLGPYMDSDLAIALTMGLVFLLARIGSWLAEYRFQPLMIRLLTPIFSIGPLKSAGPAHVPRVQVADPGHGRAAQSA